jgi:hypothetical protein
LNAAGHGVWLTLNSFAGWFTCFDMRLDLGLRIILVEALATGADELARIHRHLKELDNWSIRFPDKEIILVQKKVWSFILKNTHCTAICLHETNFSARYFNSSAKYENSDFLMAYRFVTLANFSYLL